MSIFSHDFSTSSARTVFADSALVKIFTQQVLDQLIVDQEQNAAFQSQSRTVILPASLPTFELATLRRENPDVDIRIFPIIKPNHNYYRSLRSLVVSELIDKDSMNQVPCLMVGLEPLDLLFNRVTDFHLEHDPGDLYTSAAIRDAYDDFNKLARRKMQHAEQGFRMCVDTYRRYMTREGLCSAAAECCEQFETALFDLSRVFLSPTQVACLMEQHGVEYATGFFPFDPSMMTEQLGQLATTGIHFRQDAEDVHLQYDGDFAGWSTAPRRDYYAWLQSHQFKIVRNGLTVWYSLELHQVRGPFTYFKMVRTGEVSFGVVEHAIEKLVGTETRLIICPGLKHPHSDPSVASSWCEKRTLVPERLWTRVTEYAMQLPPEAFTRQAIKQQIDAIDNRYVVRGTNVEVSDPLPPQVREDLSVAVYVYAFEQRYQSSQLSAYMNDSMRSIMSAEKIPGKLWLLGLFAARGWVESTLAWVSKWLKSEDYVQVLRPPQYILCTTRDTRYSNFLQHLTSLVDIGFFHRKPYIDRAYGGVPDGVAWTSELSADPTFLLEMVSIRRFRFDDTPGLSSFLFAQDLTSVVSNMMRILKSDTPVKPVEEESDEASFGGDVVARLNEAYAGFQPELAKADVHQLSHSLSLDPQDRDFSTHYLRGKAVTDDAPRPRKYFESKVKAFNVAPKQNTSQELLSAVVSRNFATPVVSELQRPDLYEEIFDNFLDKFCKPSARAALATYGRDIVDFTAEGLDEWGVAAGTDKMKAVVDEIQRLDVSYETFTTKVNEYRAMIKREFKMPLSAKPLSETSAPQVIVYHEKPLSAFYSSIFRVISLRLTSLLKDNVVLALRKSPEELRTMMSAFHPYGADVQYLENDFSKYDKSQTEFVFRLEAYIFSRLGLKQELVDRWFVGHTKCSVRAVSLGLSFHVMYQRKSGDATTALGNGLLNMVSVAWAYRDIQYAWAVFMGDDSLICTTKHAVDETAVKALAAVFNQSAKFFITDQPYFASNFVVVDESRQQVWMVPDPFKRIEKLSVPISADAPAWKERFQSYNDMLTPYRKPSVRELLKPLVAVRYGVQLSEVAMVAESLAAVSADETLFRSLWEEKHTVLDG